MGAKLRVVRRRIRSVESTMKITRAMELIASSRIMRAQQRVEASRPYAELLTRAMEDVARQTGALLHPLLEARGQPERIGVFVVTSDRGLAGSYNTNVLRRAEGVFARASAAGVQTVLYVAGKKGHSYFRFRGVPIEASWSGISEVPPFTAAEGIGWRLIEDFVARRIDELIAVYTDFRSAFSLRATDKRFLPVAEREVFEGKLGKPQPEYIFEPAPAAILQELVPKYVVTKIYHAMLESAASENAARQRAMKAATDNAEELIKVLTRQANRARQDEITSEIMEVMGGAEALAQASGE
jgi:F-type H+-transporting ATPase subunit gamma